MADIDNLGIKISVNLGSAISSLEKLAKALEKVNDQLDRLDPSRLNDVTKAAEEMNKAAKAAEESSKSFKKVGKNISDAGKQASKTGSEADGMGKKFGKLGKFTQTLGKAFKGLGDMAGESGKKGLKKFTSTIGSIGDVVGKSTSFIGMLGKVAKGTFKAFAAPVTLASKAIKKFGKDNSVTAQTARTLAKELTRVSKMFKLMITRMVLRQVIKNIGEGFKNLAQYSNQVNASMSLLWNSFRQLGNSIAAAVSPLLNAFAPALNTIIQYCIRAVNAINQLISSLLGLGTWTRAKKLTDSYAASLDKSTKAAKELKKTVLGFDELNQLQNNKDSGGASGTSPADMFEEVPIEDKWKEAADNIRKIWGKLTKPIKKAWAAVGDEVKAAWSGAFKSIKKLVEDVGRDFLKVWNDPRTMTMLKTMLLIFKDIGGVVKYLADGLDKAWNTNDLGLKVLRDIRDIFLVIVTHIHNMSSATVEWAKNLNFTPLLEAFEGWLNSMKPVVDNIAGVFEDFYTTVLLPLATWSIETGLPELIQVFTDFNDKVDWAGLREKLAELWKHLEPFAERVGEGFIIFIDDVAQKLADFLNSDTLSNLITQMGEFMDSVSSEDAAKSIERIAKAFLLLKGASAVVGVLKTIASLCGTIGNIIANWGIVKVLGGIGIAIGGLITFITNFVDMWKNGVDSINGWLTILGATITGIGLAIAGIISPIGIAIAAIVGLVAVIVAAIHEHWDEIVDFFKGVIDAIVGFFVGLWEGIVDIFDSIVTWFDDNVIQPLIDVFSPIVETIGKFFEGLWIIIKAVWIVVSDWFNQHVIQPLKNLFAAIVGWIVNNVIVPIQKAWDSFKTFMQNLWNGVVNAIKSVVMPIVNWIDTKIIQPLIKIWDTCTTAIAGFFTKLWDGIKSGVKAAMNAVVGVVESAVNGIIDGINWFLDLFNGAVEWAAEITGDNWSGIELIGHVSFPRFKNGGFPEDGLFMANHNELVGKFSNGRTAVANNEQITNGIAQAVFAAMTSAQSSGGQQYINNTIMVDGEVIARTVTRGQERLNRRYSPVTT